MGSADDKKKFFPKGGQPSLFQSIKRDSLGSFFIFKVFHDNNLFNIIIKDISGPFFDKIFLFKNFLETYGILII